jgi:hypothetical protein
VHERIREWRELEASRVSSSSLAASRASVAT